MQQDHWARVKEVFAQAQDMDPEERARFLNAQATTSPGVYEDVADLISAAEAEPTFMADAVAVSAEEPETPPLPPGTLLGCWRLEERIGRGGMGEVYAAQRADGAFEMRAALKLLKRGMDTDALLARFLRERRILGRLSHPNIAHLLDAGAADDGRPWLVMEHVDGKPVDEWALQQNLPVRDIVALMARVCDAVHQAHRQSIVHRDLKPSNVLVNAEGEPKLLDFGIAKLLADDEHHELTRVGTLSPMTPQFAAPEQLYGDQVTPATDVYSLGALLYLLLTRRLARRRVAAVTVSEPGYGQAPVAAPSSVIRDHRDFSDAATRRARREAVTGDLDLIVLKAMHPEPSRRYATAAELADDLHRFLELRPVAARPDSLAYRLRSFVRRNRVASAAGLLVFVVTVAGVSGVLWQAQKAIVAGKAEQAQRLRAEAREAALREVVGFQGALLDRVNLPRVGQDFYAGLMAQLDRRLSQGEARDAPAASEVRALLASLQPYAPLTDIARDTLVRELLEPGQSELAQRFGDRPEVEAALLDSLGRSYATLHVWAGAEALFARAAERHAARGDEGRLDALASRAERISMLFRLDRFDEALAEARAVSAARAELLGAEERPTLRAHMLEAAALKALGRADEALAIEEPLLEAFRKRFGPRDEDSLDLQGNLGTTYWFLSRLPEAERALREAVEGLVTIRDPLHRRTIVLRGNLGVVLLDLGRAEAARDHFQALIAELRERFGDEDAQTLQAQLNLANALAATGDVEGSLALERDLIATRLRRYGPDDLELLLVRFNHALSLRDAGRPAAALKLFEEVHQRRGRLLGPDHPDTLQAESSVATSLRLVGDVEGAGRMGRAVHARLERVLGPGHLATADAGYELSLTERDLDRPAEALRLAESALAVYRVTLGNENPSTLRAASSVADLKRQTGDVRGAEAVVAEFPGIEVVKSP